VPLPVKLQDVLEEMQMVSDEMTAYINLKTGELITITHEEVRLAEDSESEDDLPRLAGGDAAQSPRGSRLEGLHPPSG